MQRTFVFGFSRPNRDIGDEFCWFSYANKAIDPAAESSPDLHYEWLSSCPKMNV